MNITIMIQDVMYNRVFDYTCDIIKVSDHNNILYESYIHVYVCVCVSIHWEYAALTP